MRWFAASIMAFMAGCATAQAPIEQDWYVETLRGSDSDMPYVTVKMTAQYYPAENKIVGQYLHTCNGVANEAAPRMGNQWVKYITQVACTSIVETPLGMQERLNRASDLEEQFSAVANKMARQDYKSKNGQLTWYDSNNEMLATYTREAAE